MKQGFFKRAHTGSAFITLDTSKCKACWKCLDACSNDVMGRINLPWHKHILFKNRDACTGCLKCVKACAPHALTRLI